MKKNVNLHNHTGNNQKIQGQIQCNHTYKKGFLMLFNFQSSIYIHG